MRSTWTWPLLFLVRVLRCVLYYFILHIYFIISHVLSYLLVVVFIYLYLLQYYISAFKIYTILLVDDVHSCIIVLFNNITILHILYTCILIIVCLPDDGGDD